MKLSLTEKNEELKILQQRIQTLQQEILAIQRTLASAEKGKGTAEFFDNFIQPIPVVQKQLQQAFEEKVHNRRFLEFSVDEVSWFLNICELQELVEFQRDTQINGEGLIAAIDDITVIEMNDVLLLKKLTFYLQVLDSGLLLQPDILKNAAVWIHRSIDKTLLMLQQLEIALSEDVIRNKNISIAAFNNPVRRFLE